MAERFPDRILPAVDAEDREAEQDSRWGHYSSSGSYVSAEIHAEIGGKY